MWPIIHSNHYNALYFGKDCRRIGSRIRVPVEVLHLTRVPIFQPDAKRGKPVRGCGASDAYQLEADLIRLIFDSLLERTHVCMISFLEPVLGRGELRDAVEYPSVSPSPVAGVLAGSCVCAGSRLVVVLNFWSMCMKRVASLAAVVAIALGMTLVTRSWAADDSKVPTTKEIMTKLNKGPDCLKAVLAKELRGDSQDWATIQKQTKDFAEAAAALGKNTPKKGDKDSWEKFTKAYATDAKALASAADKKDLDECKTAQSKLDKSCMSCHQAHRGR